MEAADTLKHVVLLHKEGICYGLNAGPSEIHMLRSFLIPKGDGGKEAGLVGGA